MLGLLLRDEFRGARLRGTTIDFTNEAKTGALDMTAQDFLRIATVSGGAKGGRSLRRRH